MKDNIYVHIFNLVFLLIYFMSLGIAMNIIFNYYSQRSKKISRISFTTSLILGIPVFVYLMIIMSLISIELAGIFIIASELVFVVLISYYLYKKASYFALSHDNYMDVVLVSFFWSLIIFFLFRVDSYMDIAQGADVLRVHGPLVRSIMSQSYFNGTYAFYMITNKFILYPYGFHLSIAPYVLIVEKLFPRDSLIVLRTILDFSLVIFIYILIIIYEISFKLTKSVKYSFITILFVFSIHRSMNMQNFLLGYIYNGTYPNLLGLLLVLFSLFIVIDDQFNSIIKLVILGIVTIDIIFIYPPFLIFIIFIYLYEIYKSLTSSFIKIFYYISSFIILIVVMFLRKGFNFYEYFWFILARLNKELFISQISIRDPRALDKILHGIPNAYLFDWKLLVDGLYGKTYVLAFFISIIMVLYRLTKYNLKGSKTFIYLLFQIFSLIILLANYVGLSFMVPIRSLMIIFILSPIVIIASFSEFKNMKTKDLLFKIFALFILFSLILNGTFYLYISNNANRKFSWFSHSMVFKQSEPVIEKLVKLSSNSPILLLNDCSLATYIVMSETTNVTPVCTTLFSIYHYNMAKRLVSIWSNPVNSIDILKDLKFSNVTYIFVTSDYYYISLYVLGGSGRYVKKPFPPKLYVYLFDHYPYLDFIMGDGNTRLYKFDLDWKKSNIEVYLLLNKSSFNNIKSIRLSQWGKGHINATLEMKEPPHISLAKGNYSSFGIHIYLNRSLHVRGESTYLVVNGNSSNHVRFTILLFNKTEKHIIGDFIMLDGVSKDYWIKLPRFAQFDRISLVTGFKSPFPKPNGTIKINSITIVKVSS